MEGVSDPGPRAESWACQIHFEWGQIGYKGPQWWWLGSRLGGGASLRPGPLEGVQHLLFPLPPPLPHSPRTPHPCRMILSVLTGLLFGSDGYYVALAWTSSSLMYFIVSLGPPLPPLPLGLELGLSLPILAQLQLSPFFQVRSLRTAALGPDSMGGPVPRQRLQLYLTLGAAAFQPLIIYWLTFHLVR